MVRQNGCKLRFSGHQTFPFRAAWLRKAVEHVDSDPEIFSHGDALVTLGVGKNMVDSMRYWAILCGLIEECDSSGRALQRRLAPTDLARFLFLNENAWDPYLEDPATLWLLHWQLASGQAQERWGTCYYLFNRIPKTEFTKTELLEWLTVWAEGERVRTSPNSLKRDIDVCVRTYVSSRPTRTVPLEDTLACPLTELGLLRELRGSGTYIMSREEHPTLPDEIVAFALTGYLQQLDDATSTVTLEEIAFSPGSPGRVFALSEDALIQRFEQLERTTHGGLSFDETAGLRQIIISDLPHPSELLGAYYERSRALMQGMGVAGVA